MHIVKVFNAVIKHHGRKKVGEETFYFVSYLIGDSLPLREVVEGTKDRILVAGTGEQAMGKWVTQPTFLFNPGPPAQK